MSANQFAFPARRPGPDRLARLGAMLVGICLMFGAWGWAAEPLPVGQAAPIQREPLTLEQAYQLALRNNLAIKTAQAHADEAAADIQAARTHPNPSLHWDVSPIENTYRVIGIEQQLETPGKHWLRVRVARRQALGAQADYQQKVHQVLVQVRQAYIDWLDALIRADIQKDDTHITEALAHIAEKRYQAKAVSELDVTQSRLLLHQAQNEDLQAQSHVRQTQAALSGILNTPDITPPEKPTMSADHLYPLPPLDTVLQSALQHRRDLQAKQDAIQAQRDQLRLLRLSRVPDVTLQAGYDVVTHPTGHGYFISGKVDLPILDRQQGAIAKANAAYRRMLAEQAQLRQKIDTDVRVNYEKVRFQQAQWKNYLDTILPEAMAVETLVQESYRNGKTGIANALLAHQNTLGVRQQALQTFSNYQQAVSELENTMGVNPDGTP